MANLTTLDQRYVWHPFTQEKTAPPPINITSAKGATLYTEDGTPYLDLISSWWVTTHGHSHPVIAQAIAQQAQTLEQVIFAGFTHPPAIQLAAELINHLPEGLQKVFFSDNGSTSVEVALKMARHYWWNKGEDRTRFLVFEGGYHGDTVGAMSVGHTSGFFNPFKNMLFEVDTLPFPNTWLQDETIEQREKQSLQKLEHYLEHQGHQCAALLIEPLVQGASGMNMCRPQFLQQVAARLKQYGVLLLFDEVMTGFGRTGALFACEKANTTPDIICLSKGLTGGFMPMSVTISRLEVYQAFLGDSFDRAFAHGHSFTANPLGCAASLASLKLFAEENTLERIKNIENIHKTRLESLLNHPRVSKGRLTGSIAAFDIKTSDAGYGSKVGPYLKTFFLNKGLLLRPLGNVLYFLPPYCISDSQLHQAWDCVDEALLTLEQEIPL